MAYDFLKGIGGGVGSGFFGDMFDQKNPADAANPYMNKIAPMEKDYYNPYIERGNAAYDQFNPILNSMSSDPAGFLENLMKSYAPSRGYQLKRDEMMRAAGNTAAAGGTRGNIQDISNEARLDDYLMGDDMQQWLQNVLGIQGEGLKGEEGLYNTGFDATKGLTGDLANVLGTQAQLAFQGQRENNQSRSDFLSGLMKLGGAGAGFAFGGPAGAAAMMGTPWTQNTSNFF